MPPVGFEPTISAGERPAAIRATCPAHLILLDFITHTILGEQYRLLSSPLRSFLHSPVTSSLLGPNILLNTLFSNALRLRSSLNASDQVSHPYKTRGNIIVLYILIFIFLDNKLEDRRLCTQRQEAFPDFSLPLISSRIEFLCITVVPKYLNSPRPFKGATISLHTVTSSCILISRHDHVLSFISCILYYLYRSYYCNVFFFTMTQYRCLQYVYVLQAADSELM